MIGLTKSAHFFVASLRMLPYRNSTPFGYFHSLRSENLSKGLEKLQVFAFQPRHTISMARSLLARASNCIRFRKSYRKMRGMSLLEVLIVIGILAVIGTISSGMYRNFVRNIGLETSAKTILFDLKEARSKSQAGENNLRWGIHFVNGASDYYELFSTPTNYSDASKLVQATTSLPGGISFSAPSSGNSTDVVFARIAGTTTPVAITVSFENQSRTVNVDATGLTY